METRSWFLATLRRLLGICGRAEFLADLLSGISVFLGFGKLRIGFWKLRKLVSMRGSLGIPRRVLLSVDIFLVVFGFLYFEKLGYASRVLG